MGKISDRIMGSVDEFAGKYGNRLMTWGGKVLTAGGTRLAEELEPAGVDLVSDTLKQIQDNPLTPDSVKRMLDKLIKPTDPVPLFVVILLAPLILIPLITGIFQPLQRLLNYGQERLFRSGRMDPNTAIRANWRGFMTDERMRATLVDHGFDEVDIETLLDVTKFYPAPQDLVRWQAREVFEPSMISKYGLDDEFEEIEKEPFYQAGMTDEQILNYWRAHWEHASWNQVVEMLRRGQITEADVWEWFKVVEIVPYWRDKLIAISWEVPTRVDVRRFWDMRTIDETRLREIYTSQGYHGKDLEDYVLWTKIYVDFPDLMTRYKNGWLTLDDVRAELVKLGMSAGRAEELIQTKVKAGQPERTSSERDVTKTDIIKGVKQTVISRDQGIELLVEMGYDEDEADYILEINIPPDEEELVVRDRELTKADILKGLKTAIITEDQARDRLIDLRYSPADAEFLLDIYRAQVTPPEEPRDREASKADIVLAVKKGLITPEDAYLMLQDIGFTPEASQFILEVRAEASPFSPRSFDEFKDRAVKYRKAIGLEVTEMPEELKAAAGEVVRLTKEVKDLEDAVVEEKKKLLDLEPLPPEAEDRLKELQVFRNRAIAELQRVKSDYDRLIAEWRHSQA